MSADLQQKGLTRFFEPVNIRFKATNRPLTWDHCQGESRSIVTATVIVNTIALARIIADGL